MKFFCLIIFFPCSEGQQCNGRLFSSALDSSGFAATLVFAIRRCRNVEASINKRVCVSVFFFLFWLH